MKVKYTTRILILLILAIISFSNSVYCVEPLWLKLGFRSAPQVSYSGDGMSVALLNSDANKMIIYDLNDEYNFNVIKTKEFKNIILFQYTVNPAEIILILKSDSICKVKILNTINKSMADQSNINYNSKDIASIKLDRCSGLLCITDKKYRMKIFDISSGELVKNYDDNHQFHAQYAEIIDSGKYLLLINDKWEYLFDFKTEQIIKKHYLSSVSKDFKVAVSPGYSKVARFSDNNFTFYINDFTDEFFTSKSYTMPYAVLGFSFVSDSEFVVLFWEGIYLMRIEDEIIKIKEIKGYYFNFDFSWIRQNGMFFISGARIEAYDQGLNCLKFKHIALSLSDIQFTYDNSQLATVEIFEYMNDLKTGMATRTEKYFFEQVPGRDCYYVVKDSTVFIYENNTGKLLETHKFPVKINYFSFSPDMRYCQTSNSLRGPAQIWNLASKELVYSNSRAWGYGFSSKSKYVFGYEGLVDSAEMYVRKIPEGDIAFNFTKIKPVSLAVTDEEEYIYLSDQKKIGKYRIQTGEPEQVYQFDSLGHVLSWRLTKDGKYFFQAYKDGSIKQIKFETGEIINDYYLWNESVSSILLSGDEKYMAVTYYDGSLAVWELCDIVSVSPAEKGSAGPATAEIFPNPSSGEFTIAAGEGFAGEASISVCDLTGREVFRGSIYMGMEGISEQVTLPSIGTGVYMLKLRCGRKLISAMLVIAE